MISITVVTLTRHRKELLKRCIESIKAQAYKGLIKHIILIDECEDTMRLLETNTTIPDWVEWHWMPRTAKDKSGPWRVSRLRNIAVEKSNTDCVSFLDDDNLYESSHLHTLVECMERTGCPAVHSHERIFWPNDKPYLDQRIPWCRDPEQAKVQYLELCSKGVFKPGSNISYDRADPKGHPNPARTVDMGEWLFRRELLLKYPFIEEYSEKDWNDIITEDDKLMYTLIEEGVQIACTNLPTFRYYLGGFTNSFNVL